MSVCYLFPAGQNEISRKGREPGWRKKKDGSPLALDREGFRQTRQLATQLKDKGISRIYCADVHASTAQILKSALDVPIEIDEKLRPFNVGSHTCRSAAAIDDILVKLVSEWKAKPEVPVKGGDSLISYRNRFVKASEKILEKDATVALILDIRNMRFLRNRVAESLVNDHSIRPDRIYIIRRENDNPNQSAAPMDSSAQRSGIGAVYA
jgi:broad specificity phosphatase PhoE